MAKYRLDSSTETLRGTSGDDVFLAGIEHPHGRSRPTITYGDTLEGRGGYDNFVVVATMDPNFGEPIQVNHPGTSVKLSSIEQITVVGQLAGEADDPTVWLKSFPGLERFGFDRLDTYTSPSELVSDGEISLSIGGISATQTIFVNSRSTERTNAVLTNLGYLDDVKEAHFELNDGATLLTGLVGAELSSISIDSLGTGRNYLALAKVAEQVNVTNLDIRAELGSSLIVGARGLLDLLLRNAGESQWANVAPVFGSYALRSVEIEGSGNTFVDMSSAASVNAEGGNGRDSILVSVGTLRNVDSFDGGADQLSGGGGADVLVGAFSPDFDSTGVDGNDVLAGGNGNDLLTAGSGNNQLFGGNGDDVLVSGSESEILAGGAGFDTVSFQEVELTGGSRRGVVVDLRIEASQDTRYGTDTLSSIENVVGTRRGDVIMGNDRNNVIDGYSEQSSLGDVIYAMAGDDIVYAYAEDYELNGGDGRDTLILVDARVVTLDRNFFLDFEAVMGSKGNDTISGSSQDDRLSGGLSGYDFLSGNSGADTFVLSSQKGSSVRIRDFTPGIDHIELDKQRFNSLELGSLADADFGRPGDVDGWQKIEYSKTTGLLRYDQDLTDNFHGDVVARIETRPQHSPSLTFDDFLVA